ncbi:head-to-tail adaptor [Arthrobacter phage Maggie]|uniref:Head-to-tail adaptor n=22 Tax=Decurrovirus decurro TaxID=1982105 RepID=A0A345M4H1_9CAUD|nr:head-to-tail adaptor [Arthrobacter phage Jessica]ALF00852.1 head-to-tail adaptor [Arthrobacter phage Sandman]ALJ97692.1 head-to-tail adaptor [Arthrobacter phage TymAbreu]ALY09635.1 head-to-tail adaptor [Arthrobacter phage Maggie]ALY09738.1 head-to-tail adaptor [Arthrobacter phage Moloch]ALY10438.1 head-to-tail adaptor [Arthrobacter phage Stratus]ANZ52275.1 head-to-tail adaptor [Arthrobacter phage Courtney3]AOQ28342.1 head-to-tail adaptor [Arthrobacter phage Massimo]AOT26105.1 head-to-tai
MIVTVEQVRTWLGLPASDPALEDATAATNAFVERLGLPMQPKIVDGIAVLDDDGAQMFEPAADTVLGAKMLAARLYRRRNSPSGVEAITDAGTSFVARYDSDISRYLKLDGFAAPRIG